LTGGPVLSFDHVDAAYGPYKALFGVSFEVEAGSVVALVGPNGAGKSTVARVASGLIRASAGTVRVDGKDITRWPAWKLARLGVAHVPEGRSVFSTLTVEENLVLTFRRSVGRKKVPAALQRAYGAFPKLAERREQMAGTLSGGEQRMVALAKVLAVENKLLIADELSLGLAPVVVAEVYDALEQIVRGGTALMIVEQHLDRVAGLADKVLLLNSGLLLSEGSVDEMRGEISKLLPGVGGPASG
jgi:branched-chain amino acid transport system ATP-binding protein